MPSFPNRPTLLAFTLLFGLLPGMQAPVSNAATAEATAAAAIQAAALDRLEAKAELGGELPVIVQLRTDTLPTLEPLDDTGRDTAHAKRNFADRGRLIARAQDRLGIALADRPVLLHRYRDLPLAALHADRATIQHLRTLPDVLSVTEDRPHEPLLNTSVPHIGGNLAYVQGWTDAGQAVAVIDTGVQTSHPHFTGRVLNDADGASPTERCRLDLLWTAPPEPSPEFRRTSRIRLGTARLSRRHRGAVGGAQQWAELRLEQGCLA